MITVENGSSERRVHGDHEIDAQGEETLEPLFEHIFIRAPPDADERIHQTKATMLPQLTEATTKNYEPFVYE